MRRHRFELRVEPPFDRVKQAWRFDLCLCKGTCEAAQREPKTRANASKRAGAGWPAEAKALTVSVISLGANSSARASAHSASRSKSAGKVWPIFSKAHTALAMAEGVS
eukprot:2933501-Pleurochrysis_carterae.AAC.5